MLKDLTVADWLRLLNLSAEHVPHVLILRGTRNAKTQYAAATRHFSDIIEVGSPNGLFEDVLIGKRSGVRIGFACVYGAPMASEIVHLFGALGTRVVIQTGNCGGLADELNAGDLFLADRAWCGEGASQYYKADGKDVYASMDLLKTSTMTRFGVDQFHIGSIYTTSALLAESSADIQAWHEQGFAAVDMETATTYAVAEYFRMRRLSVLFVFDNPRRQEHLLLTDEAKSLRRQQADERIQQLVLDLAVELENG